MAMIIDGKQIASQLRGELKEQVASLEKEGRAVTLAVVLVGNDRFTGICQK